MIVSAASVSLLSSSTLADSLAHPEWLDAMTDELRALERTQDMVSLPAGRKAAGWVVFCQSALGGTAARQRPELF